jgi:hypothetical protein
MTNSSREDVQALNQQMIEEFYAGESVTVLARKNGRDTTTVRRLIKADQLANGPRERTATPRDPRIMLDKRILSPRHGYIGAQLSAYRARHELTPTTMGLLIQSSRVKVRNMELGDHDFTILEIEAIARILGVTFESLVGGYPVVHQRATHNESGGRLSVA